MKRNILHVFCIVSLCAIIGGCNKEEFALANRTYKWEVTLPYNDNSEISSSYLISKKIHTDWEYDSLTHSMYIQFNRFHSVNFIEKFTAHYSSAYRYTGTSDTVIFRLHPEEWEKYDTLYVVEKEKYTEARYNKNTPNINFRLKDIYITMGIGIGYMGYYDYHFINWNSDVSYTGKIISDNEIECHFPVSQNDTLVRHFLLTDM